MKRIAAVVGILLVAFVGSVVFRVATASDAEPVVIVHWANSHPMREGLMPYMAERFNSQDHETASGRPIEVVVLSCDSAVQAADLAERVDGAGHAQDPCKGGDGSPAGDPTIVTPQSSDWLVDVNSEANRDVVDLDSTENIAETWLGIVTYSEMAECLGWPEEPLGYADILALKESEEGWAALDCADLAWGQSPKLAFTNPSTSTSGRNVLISLYAMAAGKAPAELTVADIERPEVVEFVKDFQGLVDHYMPGTIPLNTKISQGVEYGQFFLMPEDNLVNLALGNEKAVAPDGTEQQMAPVDDLVMIYPEEGSVLNSNPAGIVDATWVTAESREGAQEWIDFLRSDEQQERFMAAGFRPATGTGLTIDVRQFAEWGLNASEPSATIEPGELGPDVLERIIESWGSVKNPAIVTFVVDTSGSMAGEPLAQVKAGLTRVVDAMAGTNSPGNDNQVGLVTFSTEVNDVIEPAPLADSKYEIADAISRMEARGETALYDAVQRAIELTTAASGDARSTRAVVVLSDGAATSGGCLDDLVAMWTIAEVEVDDFCAQGDQRAIDVDGGSVGIEDVAGDRLLDESAHGIQVFFVGFGEADVNVGRILAQATDAEYQGSTNEDLAAVIEELSGYF